MARKKISEYRAKKLLYNELGIPYTGLSIAPESNIDNVLEGSDPAKLYVVKVDQGVKKRGKQGLIRLKVKSEKLKIEIEDFKKQGFNYFLIEEFVEHEQSEEKYLAIERVREGLKIHYSNKGGVEIEENAESVVSSVIYSSSEVEKLPSEILNQVQNDMLKTVLEAFDKYYFSFLELNPFIIHNSQFIILDSAVEVDSAAEFFVHEKWEERDFRDYSKQEKTPEEKAVVSLAEKSQASFSLTVLNPHGSVFMLLSGGGASIVLADEAYNQGKGLEVANYGEYSGNPNAEETYLYTKEILSLLFKSHAAKKVLIVGGGVANFTDVRITFYGVIKALSEVSEKLKDQNVKVFVRRGGPNQEKGLALMKSFLEKEGIYGTVSGPDKVLTHVVTDALDYISS